MCTVQLFLMCTMQFKRAFYTITAVRALSSYTLWFESVSSALGILCKATKKEIKIVVQKPMVSCYKTLALRCCKIMSESDWLFSMKIYLSVV